MPNAVNWEGAPTDQGSILTTELNSLADTNRTNAGTEHDNSVELDTHGILELNVTFGTAPSADGHVRLFMLKAPDGTNYEDGSSSIDPGNHTWIANIPVRAVTSAQKLMTKKFELPPTKIKFILENQSGQSFPASGSIVDLYTGSYELQ